MQFGRPDQGIFAYWLNSYLRRRPLKYLGFGGSGKQVRDCLNPRDLFDLICMQMKDPNCEVEKRLVNVSGGKRSQMSLIELSQWCEERWGNSEVSSDGSVRRYDLPWVVLDSSKAKDEWGWEPKISTDETLNQIAEHAEKHPQWLETSGA